MNQIDLTNRVAVITGGVRGICFAVAARMLRSGAAVSLWDVDTAELESAHARLASLGRVTSVPVDLTREKQVDQAVRHTVMEHGRLEILVNNAGFTGATPRHGSSSRLCGAVSWR